MSFFDDIVDTITGIPGRIVDIGESGILGPGIAAGTTLASGGSLSEALQGATGGSGAAGAVGLAAEVAEQVVARQNAGVAGGGGASVMVARATAINATLGALLASNGIHPAPTANIRATVVLLLTPSGAAFVDNVERGTPAIMSRDMQILNKTLKKISKMNKKVPRKAVQPSLNAQINNQVKQKILQDVGCSSPLRQLPPAGGHCS